MAYATKEKSEANGLRRFFPKKLEEEEEEGKEHATTKEELFSPEEALFWRVIVEALANQTSSSGENTSLAVGQARAVLQAETEEVEDALDQCLPESSMDLLRIISMHADGKTTASIFSARQLMMTLNCSMN